MRDGGSLGENLGMPTHPLDNPIWSTLTTTQPHFASGRADALRYPAEVAPFVAIGHTAAEPADLVAPGEVVTLIGVLPRLPASWELQHEGPLVQMVAEGPPGAGSSGDGPTIRELGPEDVPAMLELTGIAFPGYFRRRTNEMGRYFGIHHEGRLIALAGERMHVPGFREVSGVCTHPEHTGRGHARRLVQHLMHLHAREGLTPFLHVAPENTGAIRLYEALGFTRRAALPFWQVRGRD